MVHDSGKVGQERITVDSEPEAVSFRKTRAHPESLTSKELPCHLLGAWEPTTQQSFLRTVLP